MLQQVTWVALPLAAYVQSGRQQQAGAAATRLQRRFRHLRCCLLNDPLMVHGDVAVLLAYCWRLCTGMRHVHPNSCAALCRRMGV